MKFPDDYPFRPPSFVFTNSFFHPNVYVENGCMYLRNGSRYPDGRLCISILHPPGDDPGMKLKAAVVNLLLM